MTNSDILKSSPSDIQLRGKLEEMVAADLLGPAEGENEELVERNVRDRYLVGVLTPPPNGPERQRRLRRARRMKKPSHLSIHWPKAGPTALRKARPNSTYR